MISGDPLELEPYRIEWRADLTCGWLLLTSVDTHDKARDRAEAELKRHKGQVRVVTQHVIEAKGLGA